MKNSWENFVQTDSCKNFWRSSRSDL